MTIDSKQRRVWCPKVKHKPSRCNLELLKRFVGDTGLNLPQYRDTAGARDHDQNDKGKSKLN